MAYLKFLWNELKRILHNHRAECTLTKAQLKEFAKCLLPDIIAFCESDRGKCEFEEWKRKREAESQDIKKAS